MQHYARRAASRRGKPGGSLRHKAAATHSPVPTADRVKAAIANGRSTPLRLQHLLEALPSPGTAQVALLRASSPILPDRRMHSAYGIRPIEPGFPPVPPFFHDGGGFCPGDCRSFSLDDDHVLLNPSVYRSCSCDGPTRNGCLLMPARISSGDSAPRGVNPLNPSNRPPPTFLAIARTDVPPIGKVRGSISAVKGDHAVTDDGMTGRRRDGVIHEESHGRNWVLSTRYGVLPTR